MAMDLSEEFKNQLAMQFGSSGGLADFVVPGTMPLMGSSTRWANARRKHMQSRKASTDSTATSTKPAGSDNDLSLGASLQEELKAAFTFLDQNDDAEE